jgi:hypothetical protein
MTTNTAQADQLARWLQEAIERHPAIQIRRGSQPIAYRAWAAELLARLAPVDANRDELEHGERDYSEQIAWLRLFFKETK